MVTVVLPSLLAAQAGGRGRFEVEAATVEHALRQLPVADLLLDEIGELRRLVNVYVDGKDVRLLGGLHAPVDSAREIRVIAAVAGGAPRGSSGSGSPRRGSCAARLRAPGGPTPGPRG